ncbi:MAG: AraC family transcriptional regulator [Gammaproteobacteria bacterium]
MAAARVQGDRIMTRHYYARLLSRVTLIIALLFGVGALVRAETAPAAPSQDAASLDAELQSLKQDVLALNRDLFVLEEELLFPSNTQVAVFVSLDIGEYFALDSVQLKVNDRVVTNYLYTEREVDALHRGGVQRLFTGNLKAGDHELVAIFTGKGPNGRDYRRGASYNLTKRLGPKFVELKITDNESREQPDFRIKEWD